MAPKKTKTTTRKAKKATRRKPATARKTTKRAATRSTGKKRTASSRTTRSAASKRKPTTTKKRSTTKRKSSTKLETSAIKDTFNKSQILTHLADKTELSKKQVSELFDALGNLMHRHLKKGAAGEFTIPGLMKCKVKRKPATKARKGINPFTGEPTTFKAKPARNVVKVRPLKKLKEMVE